MTFCASRFWKFLSLFLFLWMIKTRCRTGWVRHLVFCLFILFRLTILCFYDIISTVSHIDTRKAPIRYGVRDSCTTCISPMEVFLAPLKRSIFMRFSHKKRKIPPHLFDFASSMRGGEHRVCNMGIIISLCKFYTCSAYLY